jgi:tRNA splicing endonuclease
LIRFYVVSGDPLIEHAVCYVSVCDWDEGFTALDLVSHSRLAKTIQKTFVLASVDPEKDDIRYVTINWEGVS